MKLQSITRPHDFTNVASDFILKIIRAKKSRINIALSGGNTPREIYESLAKKLSYMLHPAQLHFYQVDERYVPANDEDSNQKMITKAFEVLKNSPAISHIHFHFFDTSLPIKKSLTHYAKELPKTAFDLMILGIGPDGHTASLFPNTAALKTKAKLAHTTTKEFAIKDRLTLSFPLILKSKNLLVLLKNKPEIVDKLESSKKSHAKISPKEIQNFPALALIKHKNLSIISN